MNLKPLKIFNKVRFAMNTPICASDTKNIKVKTESGGGIDILARCGVGLASRLTVIEVKDENQILAGSESVDLDAKIMLARDSAAGQFSLEAYYSKGIIIEPRRFSTPMVDNKTGDNDEDF